MSKILLVEDSDAIRVALALALKRRGHQVEALPDDRGYENMLASFFPDLVILDVMLPGGRDGFQLLNVTRQLTRAGIIMLTARDAVVDRVRGLAAGADDYLSKPFAMAEIMARVDAVLRRADNPATVTIGNLTVSSEATSVTRGGVEVSLTDTERRILVCLARTPGRVVSKAQLLTEVWGGESFDDNVVEVHISGLRRRLEAHGPRVIHTVRSRGYRLGEA